MDSNSRLPPEGVKRRNRNQVWMALCVIAGLLASRVSGQPPQGGPQDLRGEVQRLVQSLDSPRYDERQRAAARLEQLAAQKGAASLLAAELGRRVRDPGISFELRSQLDRLLARLPPDAAALNSVASQPVTAEELLALVRQLEADSYSAREGAARRLLGLASQPAAACQVMLQLKSRLFDPATSAELRHRLRPLWEKARGTWLLADPALCSVPPIREAEIRQWVDRLALPGVATGVPGLEREAARQNLLDALARDELVATIKQVVLERRAAGGLDPAADARLLELLELAHPAMVAEVWQSRTHYTIQHLLVDVPQFPENSQRASHFDRIDDRTAHVVSGNNLLPIEYPVGVAVAHPKRRGLMYHLVNLPTPRRRMAYDVAVQVDPRQRLAAITERTLTRAIEEKRYFSDLESWVLEELDPATVSRLIVPYFIAVQDRASEPCEDSLGAIAASHHGRVCHVLASLGTKEAGPLFVAALTKGQFLPPTQSAPYDWPWIAALSIAARDPWQGADDWLASLVASEGLLRLRNEPPDDNLLELQGLYAPAGKRELAEVAATAAAILLERHYLAPQAFGIKPVDDPVLRGIGFQGHRFVSPQARDSVQQWWQEQKKSRSVSRGTAHGERVSMRWTFRRRLSA